MLATVLAQPLATPAARGAAWMQIVDLLAQGRADSDPGRVARACTALRRLRADVPMATRAATARSIAGRRLPAGLVTLFAEEPAAIAAPVMSSALLEDVEWLRLLPAMPPTARALLRNRRDLAPAVAKALASFGASDFVIEGPPPEQLPPARPAAEQPMPAEPIQHPASLRVLQPVATDTRTGDESPASSSEAEAAILGGEAQIRTLVARIEAFRRRNGPLGRAGVEADPVPDAEPPIEEFTFETGTDGTIVWVEGAPRGALIGQSIAIPAEAGDHGVDGQAAGAHRRRAPFRSARLSIAGSGPAAGQWRISAVPFFDPAGGRFIGYRGSARRPRPDEVARGEVLPGLFGSGLQPDSLRQLVHELRTPLNAILGFAEMIQGQLLGPAATSYRVRAAEIRDQAIRLLEAVEDLDIAARVESQPIAPGLGSVDGAALLTRLKRDYAASAHDRAAALDLEIDPATPPIRVEPAMAERMAERLLAATLGLTEPGERIRLRLAPADDGAAVTLAIGRPQVLAGREERELLDPGYSPEGDWPDAPALGLGFALRLVRNVAAAAGGRLEIADDQFVLMLPADGDAAATGDTRR